MKVVHPLIFFLVFLFLVPFSWAWAVEPAPRITDREIIERLTSLEQGQKRLEQKITSESSRLEQKIESEVARLEQKIENEVARLEQEIRAVKSELKAEVQATNRRIDDIKWMLGIFISVALVMLGFVIRMLWLLQKKFSSLETEQEKQRKEIEFLMDMIRKLLPER